MNIKKLEKQDYSKWDVFVMENSEATFFHLSGWQEVIERSFGHKTYFLYAENRE